MTPKTCPDCGADEASNTCCVWAKARAYDDLKEEYDALESEAEELRYRVYQLEEELYEDNADY